MAKKLYAVKYAPLIRHDDVLSVIGGIFWRWAEADRFGLLNDESPYNFAPFPNAKLPAGKTDKTIREICARVAAGIIGKARREKKRIAVLWSGGVDSTAVICSLILAGINKSDLTILCTDNSAGEYPQGYLTFRDKYKFDLRKFNWTETAPFLRSLGDNIIFVTGWCADQLFGSNVNQAYPDLYNVQWDIGLREILGQRASDKALAGFAAYSRKIGIKLKYTCDALWLFNFCVKWSHVSKDFILTLDSDEQRKNVVNFYEDIEFQEWALAHCQEFSRHNQAQDAANYKRPLKEVSYEVLKDDNFLLNKPKVNSWSSFDDSWIQHTPMRVWDEDGIHTFSLFGNGEPLTAETQERNRREHLLPYLKDFIDKDEYLRGDLT